ncbi:uncharacterized protein MONOS_1844 [Monocercomonoides exilis]|uniref:uncharacterized protein n=1 Tax=Monocercomonoides exilis TaxID=2049356 RepID=UPI00355A6A42|nr:hypothetical protein MONOS_1844 [Monocercomonoides exilis]|eukprot:MONOS_1844.1-p1 / transcript=MONOS_1844.1 / gene=MONOS_1844 / organism=Monocercomonoides_exilis_PA203 / gene_product=unspecified product / transcript_product=unspecified product / location=Mono_scaffold00035:19890-21085(+) / protein_length=348 / sequence_SO=supercontig / SO=protein_coding / is_pseudo=false
MIEVQLTEDRRLALMKDVDKWKERAVKAKKQDASLWLHSMYRLFQKGLELQGWNGQMRINASITQQILQWRKILKSRPQCSLIPVFVPQAVMTTDASEVALGATLSFNNQLSDAHNRFPQQLAKQSSNHRELMEEWLALNNFGPALQRNGISRLHLRSDNTAVVYNINRWNAGKNLRPALRKIWRWKEETHIEMRATHIPGIKNIREDALSGLERAGDYEVRAEELLEILKIAQRTPTLDAFAASHNHKLERLCGINKSEKGESTSDLTPAELERPERGRSFDVDTTQELGLEAAEGSVTERPLNEIDECRSFSRTVEDCVIESIQRDGEELRKRTLEQKAFSTDFA